MTERVPEERPPLERVPLTNQGAHGDRAPRHARARRGTARSHDFTEVNLGYTDLLAIAEAERCLQCKNPKCIEGCPVRVNIPRFIDLLAHGDIHAAAESLLDDNALPCVTGRVCPQETQCEGLCLRGKKGTAGRDRLPRALRGRLGPDPPRGDDPPGPRDAAASGSRSSAPGRPA